MPLYLRLLNTQLWRLIFDFRTGEDFGVLPIVTNQIPLFLKKISLFFIEFFLDFVKFLGNIIKIEYIDIKLKLEVVIKV